MPRRIRRRGDRRRAAAEAKDRELLLVELRRELCPDRKGQRLAARSSQPRPNPAPLLHD
jgi:hypothetical protein